MGSPEAEDMYSISKPGEDKRILVLLNVHTFEDDPKKQMYRPTQQDTKSMQDTFRKFGFDVENFTDTDHISKQEAMDTIRKALKTIDQDPDSHSCFALCIMTHGQWLASDAPKYKDDLKDVFCFSDHRYLAMDDIVSLVSGCEGLKGKPKLFFMQACRGKRLFGSHRLKEDGEDEVDKATLVKKERDTVDGQELCRAHLHPQRAARVPLFPDCLISWATSPDYVSFKSSQGAPYIDQLCSTFEDYHDKLDLLTMVTIANGRVAETYATYNDEKEEFHERKQMPWMASMLRRKVFLTPPGGANVNQ